MKTAQQICNLMIDAEMATEFFNNIYDYIDSLGEKADVRNEQKYQKIKNKQLSLLSDIIVLKKILKGMKEDGKFVECRTDTLSESYYINSGKIPHDQYLELITRKAVKNNLDRFIPEKPASPFSRNGFSSVNDRLLDKDFRDDFVNYLLTGRTANEEAKVFMDAVLQNDLRGAMQHRKWFDMEKTLECTDQALTALGYDPLTERATFFDKFKKHGGMIGMRDARTLTPSLA